MKMVFIRPSTDPYGVIVRLLGGNIECEGIEVFFANGVDPHRHMQSGQFLCP